MGRAVLCALLVLLSLEGSHLTAKGEWCRTWDYGVNQTSEVFWCPNYPNKPDAKFCCGSCRWPYCCSSKKDRFDHDQCSVEMRESRRMAQGFLNISNHVEEGNANLKKGEWCHTWIYGMKLTSRVFWCPNNPDRPDAKFCCGSCRWPYCCSSKKGRFDHGRCSAEMRERQRMIQKRSTSNHGNAGFQNYLWFCMAGMITVMFCSWLCICGYKSWKWLRLHWNWMKARKFCCDQPRETGLVMERLHPVLPVEGPPNPDGDSRRVEPPSHRTVDTKGSWTAWFHRAKEANLEDQVTIVSLPPFFPRIGPDHTVKRTMKGEGTSLERGEGIMEVVEL